MISGDAAGCGYPTQRDTCGRKSASSSLISRPKASDARLFSELVDGPVTDGGAFIVNGGDAWLLQSLERVSATDASRPSRTQDGTKPGRHPLLMLVRGMRSERGYGTKR